MIRTAVLYLLLLTLPALAQGPQGGNLPDGFYPKAVCEVPDRRAGGRDPDAYNRKAKAYNQCVNAYTGQAANDTARVLFTVNSAVAAATGGTPPAPPAPGDGNLAANFYPGPACTKPDATAIAARPSGSDSKAMKAYNDKVATYNVEVNAYSACIQDYVARGQHDIAAINATVNGAVSAH